MKNGKAIALLCFVVAAIIFVVGVLHLAGRDLLWGGVDVAAALVFVILGIRSMGRKAS